MYRRLLPLLVLAPVAIALAMVAWPADDEPQPPFGVLAEEADDGDRLPAAVLESPGARNLGPAETARRIGARGGRTYYLMRGAGDSICLLGYRAPANVGTACVPWRGERLKTQISSSSFDRGGRRHTAVLAPDGYTELRVARRRGGRSIERVEDNVAFVSTDKRADLVLVGAGRRPIAGRLVSARTLLGR